VPLIRGGVFTLIRDGQQQLPTAMFNMRNIVKNSLSIQYLTPTEETPGVIEIEYFDGLRFFPKTVSAEVPGAIDLDNKAKLNLFGVTTEIQAQREALFLAACAKYRRKLVKFTTEMDGFIPAYGDLIAISHDVPSWGTSGEVVDYDPATGRLTLSEPVRLLTAGRSYIMFARSNGQPHGAYEIAPLFPTTWDQATDNWDATALEFNQVSGTEITLQQPPDYPIETDLSRERTRFAFGGADSYYQLARVIAITPRNIEQVEIVAISEDNRVHAADGELNPQTARTGVFADDIISDYDLATTEEKAVFAFYSRADGTVGANNDRGYDYAN
jgi:hypothetical protein